MTEKWNDVNIVDFWQPETGTYRVVCLDDGEYSPSEGDKKFDSININIEVDKQRCIFGVGFNPNTGSNTCLGQLKLIRNNRSNKTLIGAILDVTVMKQGNKRKYNIKEYRVE